MFLPIGAGPYGREVNRRIRSVLNRHIWSVVNRRTQNHWSIRTKKDPIPLNICTTLRVKPKKKKGNKFGHRMQIFAWQYSCYASKTKKILYHWIFALPLPLTPCYSWRAGSSKWVFTVHYECKFLHGNTVVTLLLIEILREWMQGMWDSKTTPGEMGWGLVTLLHKKGATSDIINYRTSPTLAVGCNVVLVQCLQSLSPSDRK